MIARLDPSAAQKGLVEAQADLAAADANLASERVKSTTSVAEADAAVAIATQELDQQRKFQATDPEIFSRNQIIEADIDVSLSAARRDQAALEARIARGVTRANVDLDEIERKRVTTQRDRASAALASMEIRAPGDGVLVLTRERGELMKLGSTIWGGQLLAEIPDVSAMEAELFVLEADGDGLAVGQPADVVIQSRPGEIVRGTIKSIDKVAKPRQAIVPINYYSVVVSFATTDREAMKPGQRVRAKIVLADQRAVVVPRQAVFERGGHAIVYRRDLVRGFVPTVVALGPATSGRVVIASGLGEGDVRAPRDPAEVTTRGSSPTPGCWRPPTWPSTSCAPR